MELVNTSDGPLFKATVHSGHIMAGENKHHSVWLAWNICGGLTCSKMQVLKWTLLSQGEEFQPRDLPHWFQEGPTLNPISPRLGRCQGQNLQCLAESSTAACQ